MTLAELDMDRACRWLERAAIREFDGGQSRAEAEAGASLEVFGSRARRPRADALRKLGAT